MPGNSLFPKATPSDRMAVVHDTGHFGLVALQHFAPGEILFRIEGTRTARPTRYTLQIDENVHVDLPSDIDVNEVCNDYYWRFMNHSCDPNTMIRRLEVVAIRPISAHEQITFNYNTTEMDMAEPFTCHCGHPSCLGTIRGFRHLSVDEQLRLQPLLSPYLQRHLAGLETSA